MPRQLSNALAVTIALLAIAAPAAGHVGAGGTLALEGARALPGGLYEVELRTGAPVTTHGPDRRATADAPASPADPPERAPACAPADSHRVLYGRPLTRADRLATTRPLIAALLGQANARLDAAARESGRIHADLRADCDSAGGPRVDGFINLGSASFADVVDAARLAGATREDVDYVIFYDDPSPEICGMATYQEDDRLAADNASNSGGDYAVVYADCWDSSTLLHEIAHTLGAVQPAAPNSTGSGGHCRDEWDVMCYDDGADARGVVERCVELEAFDCGYDDYFDAAPEAGEYLASHWNLGSPLNRFVEFSPLAPHENPPFADPDTGDDGSRGRVRIVRGTLRRRTGTVAALLACPISRDTPCTGHAIVRRGARTLGRAVFWVDPGDRDRFTISIPRLLRPARLRVVIAEPGVARSSRIVRVRRAG